MRDRFGRLINQEVSQYHIATFLGITPQHLSRLKKEYKN